MSKKKYILFAFAHLIAIEFLKEWTVQFFGSFFFNIINIIFIIFAFLEQRFVVRFGCKWRYNTRFLIHL